MWRDEYEPDIWDEEEEDEDEEYVSIFYDSDYDLAKDIEECYGPKEFY